METAHLIHWLDHSAARAFVWMRSSPAWFFVTMVGTLGVGLTLLLFVSMIEQSSRPRSQVHHVGPASAASRVQLENSYEWSTQDRWRVAHLFVPHRPPLRPRDIQLDSRLLSSGEGTVGERNGRGRSSLCGKYPSSPELEVRLELNRPRRAEQDRRLVAASVLNFGENQIESRVRQRDSRLMVQAAWEFGSDCVRSDFVSLPVRRTMTVPEPEPEMPPSPVRRLRPDLGFAMDLLRHFSTASYFPPDSSLVSVSNRTVFPPDERWLLTHLAADQDPGWRRSQARADFEMEEPVASNHPNLHNLLAQISPTIADDPNEFDESLPAETEVSLRVKWGASSEDSEGPHQQSRLVISNEGQDPLHRIIVLDLIAEPSTVDAADPEGAMEALYDPETGAVARLIHREKQSLGPGDSNEFYLKWNPVGGRQSFHRTRVIAQAAVFASTEVVRPEEPEVQTADEPLEQVAEKRPGLACDVQYLDRAFVGDKVEFSITVRNTGDIPLHNVLVRIEVPDQLSHPDGKTVVFDAGNLDVRSQNQTVLKMSALQVGDAINALEVAAFENVEVRGSTRMLIVDRGKEPNSLPPLPETIPASLKHAPAASKPKPNGECCCQRMPVIPAAPPNARP